MNTDNYEQFATAGPATNRITYIHTFQFTLQPSDTGFYIGIRDNGTCVGIWRVRVYRYNCQSFQSGLVLYPDAPAPVSDSENITFSCVPNAVNSSSAQVTCNIVMEHGVLRILCVNVTLDMRIGRQSVSVS